MATRGWHDVSAADVARLQRKDAPAAKASKYRNVKTVVDGITFDSKREAQYWAELRMRERAGDISNLERQVPYYLCCHYQGEDRLVSTYLADFRFTDKSGAVHVVDAKGKRTAMYQLKKKWLALGYGVEIEEV